MEGKAWMKTQTVITVQNSIQKNVPFQERNTKKHMSVPIILCRIIVKNQLITLKKVGKMGARKGPKYKNPLIKDENSGNATGKRIRFKLPDILTYEERLAYLLECDNWEDLLFARIGLFSGLRLSEILNLEPRDIDFGKSEIKVRQGKGGKDRIVPLDWATQQILKCYTLEKELNTHDPIFTYANRTMQRHVEQIAERAGIDRFKVTPHTFRHTCATWLIDQGMDTSKVQKVLGHADLETIQIYTHLNMRMINKSYQDIIGAGVA
jgi:integrase